MPRNVFISFLLLFILVSPRPMPAQQPSSELEQEIQDLKQQVLRLNRNLFILQEDLLFPANTRFNVFLSLDAGKLFALDSVQLKINDKVVANHLYTAREIDALKRGGVQRLFEGNLPSGEHEIVALFIGKGPNGRDYRRGKAITIDKGSDPQYVQLVVRDDPSKEQPVFDALTWE